MTSTCSVLRMLIVAAFGLRSCSSRVLHGMWPTPRMATTTATCVSRCAVNVIQDAAAESKRPCEPFLDLVLNDRGDAAATPSISLDRGLHYEKASLFVEHCGGDALLLDEPDRVSPHRDAGPARRAQHGGLTSEGLDHQEPVELRVLEFCRTQHRTSRPTRDNQDDFGAGKVAGRRNQSLRTLEQLGFMPESRHSRRDRVAQRLVSRDQGAQDHLHGPIISLRCDTTRQSRGACRFAPRFAAY
jgi:hypothetical protein